MLDEDENVINEMQNSLKNKNKLRVKHLAQLEEKKTNLEGLKQKINQQFFPLNPPDIEKLLKYGNLSEFDESKLFFSFSIFLIF